MIKGFKFGMLLQLAIGPMCLFVFQTAATTGFWSAEAAVVGTAVVDSSEILLAILGVGLLLQKKQVAKRFLKWFGVFVLLLFGVSSMLGAFGISFLPQLQLFQSGAEEGEVFARAVLLALSDPLTIVFWSGVFSAKITEESFSKAQLWPFAAGCVSATLFFLSFVSLLGSFTEMFVPPFLISCCNFAVGAGMVWFAYLHGKPEEEVQAQ